MTVRVAAKEFAGMRGMTHDFPARPQRGAEIWRVELVMSGAGRRHIEFIGQDGKTLQGILREVR
jgi:hypothetical protein